MAIRKQEFYEGAALHLLVRAGGIRDIQYAKPFFVINSGIFVYVKYSTKGRSPWGFTFMPEEQRVLEERANEANVVIGLVCGGDGIAALHYNYYCTIANGTNLPIHVSCSRRHGQQYKVSGPAGELSRKIPPSLWQRIVVNGGAYEAL